MNPRDRLLIARRTLLLGAGGTLLLAACSDDSAERSPSTASSGPDDTPVPQGAHTLVSMFNAGGPFLVAGIEQRAPFTIGDERGLPDRDSAPEAISLRIEDLDTEEVIVEPATIEVRTDGVPVPYYPLRFTVESPGHYGVVAEVNGQEARTAFTVVHPSQVQYPLVGEQMTSVQTPTTDDARGVDPICTADPPCPLHEVSVHDALEAGERLVLLVGTPQFCQTSTCGPTLELVVEAAERIPGVQFVHAEVFESAEAVQEGNAVPAPVMGELSLEFEPALFVVDGSGMVRDLLVSTMDRSELADALSLIA